MRKQNKQKQKDFDDRFDDGEQSIDFSSGVVTDGLGTTMKLPPMDVPAWLALEIERLARFQANSKSSIVRQLLVEALESRRRRMAS